MEVMDAITSLTATMAEAAIITTCMPIRVPFIVEVAATTSVLMPHVLVHMLHLVTLPVLQGTREWTMGAMTTTVATMASTIVVEATTTIAAILAAVRAKAAAMVVATTMAIVAVQARVEATTALLTPSRTTAVARCASRRAEERNEFRAALCVAQVVPLVQQALHASAAAVRIVEAVPLTAAARMEVVHVVAPAEADRMVVDIRDAKSE